MTEPTEERGDSMPPELEWTEGERDVAIEIHVMEIRESGNGGMYEWAIGALMGLTRERVRQILDSALRRCRHPSRLSRLAQWARYPARLRETRELRIRQLLKQGPRKVDRGDDPWSRFYLSREENVSE